MSQSTQRISSTSIRERFTRLLVEQFGIDEEEVTPDAVFSDDFGADSLDSIEIVMAMEEQFGIEISDEDANKLTRVREAIAYLEAHATK